MRTKTMRTAVRGRSITISALAAALAGTAQAQNIGAPIDLDQFRQQLEEETARLNALQRSLDEQESSLGTQRQQLREQRRRLEALYQRMTGRGAPPSIATPSSDQGEPLRSAQTDSTAPAKPVGEAPRTSERPPEVAPIGEQAGVLTPQGKLVLEPSLQYLHSTNNRVALVGFTIIPAITIGLIDIRRVSRDTFVGALTGRYGLTNRLEVEAKVPYVYAKSSTITRPLATPSVTDSVFDASGDGIGDVELAARYQINQGGVDKPYYLGSFRVRMPTGKSPYEVAFDPITTLQTKLPTGTGFYGLQPGITALFPSDPVVFFGGLSYMYNIERDVGNGFGRISPGNVFDATFGMGLALNEKASFSIGYQHSVVGKPSQEGQTSGTTLAPTSTLQLGTVRFGFSYRLTDKTNLNLTLGVGATRDAPDLELTLRAPMTFF